MNTILFGYLTIVALVLMFVLAAFASVLVRRMQRRPPTAKSEEIGSATAVIKKLRKREPMSKDELDFAKQIVADRSSFLAFCIPGTVFMLGCFYVFGSLYHLHGADALRADISRGDTHVDLHEPHHSDAQQREVERASAQSFLNRHRACPRCRPHAQVITSAQPGVRVAARC